MKILHIKHTDWAFEIIKGCTYPQCNELCAGNARRALSIALSKNHEVHRCGLERLQFPIAYYDLIIFNLSSFNYDFMFKVQSPVLGILTELRYDIDWYAENGASLWQAIHLCRGVWAIDSAIPIENTIDYPLPICMKFHEAANKDEKGDFGITGFWHGWGGCITSAKILSTLGLRTIIPTNHPEKTNQVCKEMDIKVEIVEQVSLQRHYQLISRCRLGMQLSHEDRAGGAAMKAAIAGVPFISTPSDYWARLLFPELLIYTPVQAFEIGKTLLEDEVFYKDVCQIAYQRAQECSLENEEYIGGLEKVIYNLL